MSCKRYRRQASRTAAAAVEFVCVSSLFLLMLVGTWEVARFLQVEQVVVNAAREGARLCVSGEKDQAAVTDAVRSYLTAALGPGAAQSTTIEIDNETHPDRGPEAAIRGDRFHVFVSVAFKDVRWTSLDAEPGDSTGAGIPLFVFSETTTCAAEARWYSGRRSW